VEDSGDRDIQRPQEAVVQRILRLRIPMQIFSREHRRCARRQRAIDASSRLSNGNFSTDDGSSPRPKPRWPCLDGLRDVITHTADTVRSAIDLHSITSECISSRAHRLRARSFYRLRRQTGLRVAILPRAGNHEAPRSQRPVKGKVPAALGRYRKCGQNVGPSGVAGWRRSC
jgi:hypothetical protein